MFVLCLVVDGEPVWSEEEVDFMIGKESPLEFKVNRKMLRLKRTNRVFEVFEKMVPLRKATIKSLAAVEKVVAATEEKWCKRAENDQADTVKASEGKTMPLPVATKKLEGQKWKKTLYTGASKKA